MALLRATYRAAPSGGLKKTRIDGWQLVCPQAQAGSVQGERAQLHLHFDEIAQASPLVRRVLADKPDF